MKPFSRNTKIAILYLALTLALTWLCQFMPMILGLNIEQTSGSSFDLASVFFMAGGVMPTLLGVVFVFAFYSKAGIKDFLKRCFVPNRQCILAVLLSLGLVCFEVFAAQLISKGFGADNLGFEGVKQIAKNPLYIFHFLFWGLLCGPLSEEFGWREFLTDCLLDDKNKIFNVSLFIGFIWGIWHFPSYFYPEKIQHEWFIISPLLGLAFIVSCMCSSLVYSSMYVIAKRKAFPIFFLHMFKNIILTGVMIYPFSETYSIVVIPVEIILDVLFYVIITHTKYYKKALDSLAVCSHLK